MPREIWEEVNQLYLSVADHAENGVSPRRRDSFLKSVIRGCQALTGLIEGTLSHGPARNFIELGRQLERADMTTRIVDVRSASLLPQNPEELLPFENLQWMSVLKSLTAYQMYRQQVRLRVRGPEVLRFLLQDPNLPRSIVCSLETLGRELTLLPRQDRPAATVSLVRADVVDADIQALAHSPSKLHAFIDELQIGFAAIHDTLSATYFVNDDSVPRVTQTQSQSRVRARARATRAITITITTKRLTFYWVGVLNDFMQVRQLLTHWWSKHCRG